MQNTKLLKVGREMKNLTILPLVMALAILTGLSCEGEAADTLQRPNKLVWHHYKLNTTCPDAEAYIKHQVYFYWKQDKSIAAKLLRLLSADCLSKNGCDASILLDGPNSEKTAARNQGLGGFVVIDKIKYVLEARCPGVVSCADILNLAARDAVHLAGAPSYPVYTGRKDGFTSSVNDVDFPSPSISLQQALKYFQSNGLDELDMTTLLGAHTMGKTHCRYITDRLYNFKNTGKADPNMDASLLRQLRKQCPPKLQKGRSDPTVYLNPESGADYKFTGSYYSRLLSSKAVLEVDKQLLFSNDTMEIAQEFATASGFEDFRQSFALSMSRMGNIKVLTGNQGEIRRNCRRRN